MTTFDQFLDARDRDVHLDVRIEGLALWLSTADTTAAGEDARYRFCYGAPAYAANQEQGLYVATLCDPKPSLLGEQVDLFGGFPKRLGGITVNILDDQEFLTNLLRTESPALTLLDEDLDASETSIDVLDASALTETDTIFIGGEMMKIDAIASNTLTVVRGYGGTDAYSHREHDKIFLYTPYILGRRLELVIAPANADGLADERVVGEYVIDGCSWSRDANVWTLTGKSQLKYIDRSLPRVPRSARIVRYEENQNALIIDQASGEGAAFRWAHWPSETTSFPVNAWIQVGHEIIGVGTAFRTILHPNRRGELATPLDDLDPGTLIRQVFISDPSVLGSSFRYSPGPAPSTDLTSGTWIKSDHWIDIILALLTSPASADDPFGIGGNEDATYGNWSVLPAGYGLGIPASLIDFPSFLSAKARSTSFKFPNLIYGVETKSASELISEHFLRPMGAYFAVSNGLISIVFPRLPLLGEAVTTIGEDDFLTEEKDELTDEPRVDSTTNTALHTPGVTYIVGPLQAEMSFQNNEFGDTYGQRGFYVTDRDNARLPIPSGDVGLRTVYGARAQARLFRLHRPNIELDAEVHFETAWRNGPGSIVGVTLPELVERGAGTRGWTDVVSEVLEREEKVNDEDGLHGRLRLITYGPQLRIGRICPSAIITDVAANVVTVEVNRYTASDGDVAALPETDAETFAVDMIARLISRDGVDVGGGNEQVIGVSGNDITLSGDFSGALAIGRVLIFATFDEADAALQRDRYAFGADRATQTVDDSTTTPYLYGES